MFDNAEKDESLDLPTIPDGWTYRALGDLLQSNGLSYGIVQPGSDDPSGIPIVRVKNLRAGRVLTDDALRVSRDIEGAYRRTRLSGGEVLMSLVGSVGEVAVAPPNVRGWNVARAIAVIRVEQSVSSSWIRLCLSSGLAQHHMQMWQTTTVQATLNLRDVRRIPIVLPPVGIRDAITDMISALDDKIAVNDRIAAAIDTLLNAEFSAGTRNVARTVRIGDLVSFKYGKALKEEDRTPGRIPVFGGNGISGWHDTPLEPGPGIIIGRKGANAGSVSWSQGPFWAIDTSFYVEALLPVIPLEFLLFLLEGAGLRGHVGDSAIPGLNREIALSCTVKIPADEVIDRFSEKARSLLVRNAESVEESRALAELRDTLLPKLMSGEIRVRDAEKAVEDVT